jgi:hypothetical protein
LSELAHPHRGAAVVTRCDDCETPATNACLRCGRPQCSTHATRGDRRCAPCEADWNHRALSILRVTPGKLGGLRTFGQTVIGPSGAISSLVAIVIAFGGAIKGSVLAGLLLATQVWLALFTFGVLTLSVPFVAIGTPLFARRKIKELAQTLRHSNARRRFLEERAQALLPAKPDVT